MKKIFMSAFLAGITFVQVVFGDSGYAEVKLNTYAKINNCSVVDYTVLGGIIFVTLAERRINGQGTVNEVFSCPVANNNSLLLSIISAYSNEAQNCSVFFLFEGALVHGGTISDHYLLGFTVKQ